MNWLGVNNTSGRELFVPVPAAEAYGALVRAVKGKHKLKSEDDFTLAVTFSVSLSAWTWGEKVSGQVIPVDGGSTIRLAIAPNVGGQIAQGGRNQKIADEIFDQVSAILRASRS